MNTQNDQDTTNREDYNRTLDKQLDATGWGLFFIMIGVLWLLPEGKVHEDSWLIGMGAIIFCLNGIRYLYGIRVQGFRTVIGIIALIFGVSGVFSLDLPVFQMLIIIFGISIILKPWKNLEKFQCCDMMNAMCIGKSVNHKK